jgi:hypothetical protein
VLWAFSRGGPPRLRGCSLLVAVTTCLPPSGRIAVSLSGNKEAFSRFQAHRPLGWAIMSMPRVLANLFDVHAPRCPLSACWAVRRYITATYSPLPSLVFFLSHRRSRRQLTLTFLALWLVPVISVSRTQFPSFYPRGQILCHSFLEIVISTIYPSLED